MKGWGANIRGQYIKKRRELTAELADLESLEEDNSLKDEQLLRRGHIQNELLELMEKEEEYWHQKASEKWLLHGDNNTEYFHRIANGRKRKKTIFSLQHDQDTIQGTPDLLKHATEFYKYLFGPVQQVNMRLRDNVWETEEQLSDLDRDELDRDFSDEEVKQVIDSMEKK